MHEEILDDIRMILNDRNLFDEFIKIDDIGEMYNFCRNLGDCKGNKTYSKEEFSHEVEDLIESLPENIYYDCEW